MGKKKKKKFIDKSKAISFHLVQRAGDNEQGTSNYVLQPANHISADDTRIPANFPKDLLQVNEDCTEELKDGGYPSFPSHLFPDEGPRVADDYDYNKHMKPMQGQGVFFAARDEKGAPIALDENNPRYLEAKEEDPELQIEQSKLMELPEQGNFRLTKDFMRALEDSDGDFEELDDDFVTQAMQSGDDVDEGDEEDEEDEEDEGDEGDEDEGEEDEVEEEEEEGKGRKNREIDNEFDRLMGEYDDDHVGDLAEIYEQDPSAMMGAKDVGTHGDYIEDFASRKDRNYKPGVDNAAATEEAKEIVGTEGDITLYRVKPKASTTMNDLKVSQKVIKEQAAFLEKHVEDDQAINAEIQAMKEPVVRNKWDCESIVSTYSNLENHPSIIPLVRKNKSKEIKLSNKTGIPVGYFPTRETKIEEEEEEDEGEEGEEEEEGQNLGVARPKKETKEDKKARKDAVKAARKENRNRKKELKSVYKSEDLRQANNDMNQKKHNPAGMKL